MLRYFALEVKPTELYTAHLHTANLYFKDGSLLVIETPVKNGFIGDFISAEIHRGGQNLGTLVGNNREIARFWARNEFTQQQMVEYLTIAKQQGLEVIGAYIRNKIGIDEWKEQYFPFWMITSIREISQEVMMGLKRGEIQCLSHFDVLKQRLFLRRTD